VRGGARLIQVRAKSLASGSFLTLCQRTVTLVRPLGGFVIVNDRADLAAMAGASGVHVGQEDLSPADARAVVGSDAIIGLSTHSGEQVVASALEPISYIAVGPVFGTASKDTGYKPVGL
jgi:thiamine-phosphate pyrophosphorylase